MHQLNEAAITAFEVLRNVNLAYNEEYEQLKKKYQQSMQAAQEAFDKASFALAEAALGVKIGDCIVIVDHRHNYIAEISKIRIEPFGQCGSFQVDLEGFKLTKNGKRNQKCGYNHHLKIIIIKKDLSISDNGDKRPTVIAREDIPAWYEAQKK